MYVFIVEVVKHIIHFAHWMQQVGIVKMGSLNGLLIIVPDGHFPETELPCVNPLEVVWVLDNNKFFEHTDCFVFIDLYSEGTLSLLAIDETADGIRIDHCG